MSCVFYEVEDEFSRETFENVRDASVVFCMIAKYHSIKLDSFKVENMLVRQGYIKAGGVRVKRKDFN